MRQQECAAERLPHRAHQALAGIFDPDGLQPAVRIKQRQDRQASQHLASSLEDAAVAYDGGWFDHGVVRRVEQFFEFEFGLAIHRSRALMRRHGGDKHQLPDAVLAAQADQGFGALHVRPTSLPRGGRARFVGAMDERAYPAVQSPFIDTVRQFAAKDPALGEGLQICGCLRIPYQRANREARGGECGAGGTPQKSARTGDQHGLAARAHEDEASSAARSCSAWAATRRALAIRVSVRPFAGMKRQLDPSAT